MAQRFRQNIFFVAEDEIHIFADVHLAPGQYSGWVSTSISGHPDHRYELHLSYEQLRQGGWLNGDSDKEGRNYNVTSLVEAGVLTVW
ncbi:hypothetical protein [Devosia sp. Leaf64]|jgi:hypothetical protein|uniref:hypothetical protein n=1 Tax=Devosia sp. Leaf64 TaxID=1736229 RepID=UPI000A4A453C|nr:hypothetical protein [Devosia sp. Leaf64]